MQAHASKDVQLTVLQASCLLRNLVNAHFEATQQLSRALHCLQALLDTPAGKQKDAEGSWSKPCQAALYMSGAWLSTVDLHMRAFKVRTET